MRLFRSAAVLLFIATPHAATITAAEFRILKEFDVPTLGVPLVVGSTIYGTTYGPNSGYSIFKVNTDGSDYESLYNFSDVDPGFQFGYRPSGPLAFDGTSLYGTAESGGPNDRGTVYAFSIQDRQIRRVAAQPAINAGSLLGLGVSLSGSTLAGATGYVSGDETLYRVQTDGSGFEKIFDFQAAGYYSPGNVLLSGGTIYGVVQGQNPTLYSINVDGSGFQILHEFLGYMEGDGGGRQLSSPTKVGSTLYGVSPSGGGPSNDGTVYTINVDGSGYQVLHEFNGLDGQEPVNVAIMGPKLIGMTLLGGAEGAGTIFLMDTDGSNFEILHNFSEFSEVPSLGLAVSGDTAYGFKLSGSSAVLYSIVVPEPSTYALGICGIIVLAALGRRRCARVK